MLGDEKLPAGISRRDFVNGGLIASGAMLLGGCDRTGSTPAGAEAGDKLAPSGSAWTGYGGIGDYRWSNGNTAEVRDAAHRVRDREFPDATIPAEEEVDLLVVGAGFSGMSAAYEFWKQRSNGQTILLLDNHPVPGGLAKQNELEIEGQRLVAPQGSNAALLPTPALFGTRYHIFAEYWAELGLPKRFELEPLSSAAARYRLPNDHFEPMMSERAFATGYHFPGRGWCLNPMRQGFRNTPWPTDIQRELSDFSDNRRDIISGRSNPDQWLDTLTYADLLRELGYGQQVLDYVDPLIAISNFGVRSNAISALAAKRLTLPGTIASTEKSRFDDVALISFPGGNTTILRAMLRRLIPDSITGGSGFGTSDLGMFNHDALDRPGAAIRVRTSATVVRVGHDGEPASSRSVTVSYARHGKTHHVRAKTVVMGCGGWMTKHLVTDLPDAHQAAFDGFHYGPVMVVNVGVRNWRFFDKLGITVARSFGTLGWHVSVRRNVSNGQGPFTPDSPTILTYYIPLLSPGPDAASQASASRQQLMALSFTDIERTIRTEMSEMFGPSGFDHRRDIAGIIVNRWGHAYFAPQPGFFFGRDGDLAPHDVIRRPHGRIIFAHSELQGNMNMAHAMLEGRRGGLQALEIARH